VLSSLKGKFAERGRTQLYVMTDGQVVGYGGITDVGLEDRLRRHRERPINHDVAAWMRHVGGPDMVWLVSVGFTDEPDALAEQRLISELRRLGANLNISRGGRGSYVADPDLNRGYLPPGTYDALLVHVGHSVRQTRWGERVQMEMRFLVDGELHDNRVIIGTVGAEHNASANRRNNRRLIVDNCQALLGLSREPTVEEMKELLRSGIDGSLRVTLKVERLHGRWNVYRILRVEPTCSQ
jgi:predicted GIY-YIG superfamily endonuclease